MAKVDRLRAENGCSRHTDRQTLHFLIYIYVFELNSTRQSHHGSLSSKFQSHYPTGIIRHPHTELLASQLLQTASFRRGENVYPHSNLLHSLSLTHKNLALAVTQQTHILHLHIYTIYIQNTNVKRNCDTLIQ